MAISYVSEHRYSIRCVPDTNSDIAIGDFLYYDTVSHTCFPAKEQADQGTEAANQELFHDNFLGIAIAASGVGQSLPIGVATAGVFLIDCDSATYDLGELVGLRENAGGTLLRNQSVKSVSTANLAVGRVERQEDAAVTSVNVLIVSSVM